MIKGFETDDGTAILEQHLLKKEVKRHYGKLLYDKEVGKINIQEIEDFHSNLELFNYDDVA